MKSKYNLLLMLSFTLFAINAQMSCKKYIELPAPATSTSTANVYTDNATAASVLTGVYAQLSNLNTDLSRNGLTSISLYAGLSADELVLYDINDSRYAPYYKNELTNSTSSGTFWPHLYSIIFIANSAIEGLTTTNTLTPAVKQQLLGEAKFVRAICYFYLVNLYGDVPLATSSDYKLNSSLSRSSKQNVLNFIINDLKEAETLLSENYLMSDAMTAYVTGNEQRVRPTTWAASALLARAYLFSGDWLNAETQSTKVINKTSLFNLTELDGVFKMNSAETIWSLQPVNAEPNSNTGDGALFILPPTGPNSNPNTIYLNNTVIKNFESNDQRRLHWIDSVTVGNLTYYFPYKYKIGAANTPTAEYVMILRLAEQYLIRAEARANMNRIIDAQSDLNVVRTRAGLSNTSANNQSDLLQAILHERFSELFTELGHRWIDLKRIGKIDEAMILAAPLKGATWSTYKALYPIPQDELKRAVNLIQNNGY